jgi:hypothetical protein
MHAAGLGHARNRKENEQAVQIRIEEKANRPGIDL